jgi:hypothetical protein
VTFPTTNGDQLFWAPRQVEPAASPIGASWHGVNRTVGSPSAMSLRAQAERGGVANTHYPLVAGVRSLTPAARGEGDTQLPAVHRNTGSASANACDPGEKKTGQESNSPITLLCDLRITTPPSLADAAPTWPVAREMCPTSRYSRRAVLSSLASRFVVGYGASRPVGGRDLAVEAEMATASSLDIRQAASRPRHPLVSGGPSAMVGATVSPRGGQG